MKRPLLLAILFCAGVLLVADLWASSVLPVTFRQMQDNWTDAVVRAEVVNKDVSYVTLDHVDRSGRKTQSTNIYTRYKLRLKDVLYGENPGSSFELYMFGGKIGDIAHFSSVSFDLEPGWDVVIHLQLDQDNDIYVSAGTAHTVFVARHIDGQEIFVNLADLPDATLGLDALSDLRTDVGLDDLIRNPEYPPFLEYQTLKAVFQEGGQ